MNNWKADHNGILSSQSRTSGMIEVVFIVFGIWDASLVYQSLSQTLKVLANSHLQSFQLHFFESNHIIIEQRSIVEFGCSAVRYELLSRWKDKFPNIRLIIIYHHPQYDFRPGPSL
jgi:hypothetical protein